MSEADTDAHDVEERRRSARRSVRNHVLAGAAGMVAIVFGFGGWATTMEIAGAVIAPGTVVVERRAGEVQHLTGGIVGEIAVEAGDRVSAGEVLVRLDETATRANLAIVERALDELYAREARLRAERDERDELQFADALSARLSDPEVERLVASEQRLFDLRRGTRDSEKARLSERITQIREEIAGIEVQVEAKVREIGLVAEELVGVRDLRERDLVPISRAIALEREAARLAGERGQLISAIAQARGRISEIEVEILNVDQRMRSEVARELREVQARIGELVERRVTALDQLRRIDIVAPVSGRVHELVVYTVGQVVQPGETLMRIVPDTGDLVIDAQVAPQDIDQVLPGQDAFLRFSAFSQRTTPELHGTVVRISPDIVSDQRTGLAYYEVRISVPEAERERLGAFELLPGMPVESFIRTGDRTVLSYLVKPLSDHLTRAFRQD